MAIASGLCFRVCIAACLLLPFTVARAAAEPVAPVVERRLVVAGQGYFPVARQLQDGRIAVVLRGGAGHVGLKGRLDIVFSSDQGKSWTRPAVVSESPVDNRNPAFGQAKEGALVVAFWRTAKDTFKDYQTDSADQPVNTWVTRSEDGGRTWLAPAEIDVRDIGYGSPYGKMLTLADGSMLMNVYGYGIRKPGERLESKVDYSYLYRSTDAGRTWARQGTIGKGFNETGLASLPDGTLLAAMRSAGDKANVWVSRSIDEGRTWSVPQEVSGKSAHPADLAQLADGRLLLVTGFRANPFGVAGVIGDAAGRFDWAEHFMLVTDSTNGDTGYPSSVVLKNGSVLTFYYSTGSKTHPEWGVHCGEVEFTPPGK